MATDSNDDLNSNDSNSNHSNSNDDDCICQNVWEKYLKQLDSFREFLEDIITDHPSIHCNALKELEEFQEEFTRKIDTLIDEICERCGRHHDTVDCKTEDGMYVQSNAGCNAKNHHVLL